MVLYRNVVYLVLVTLLHLIYFATPPVGGDLITFRLLPQLENKPVLKWSVNDVVEWMNHTIGYSEYSDYIRKHLIDGLTLLEMEPADFENFFPITNPLHVIKIQAHIKFMRGQCSCNDTAATTGRRSFWNYMKSHSVRTWVEGTTALYFSRVAMLSTYLFDHELYMDVIRAGSTFKGEDDEMGDSAVNPKGGSTGLRFRKFVYWVSWIFAPDLYLAYHSARLCGVNYFLMPLMVIHFLNQAGNEYLIFYAICNKTAFTSGTSILERIWSLYAYTIAAPIAGLVVGYIFPVILQYICVVAVVIHNLVVLVGVLMLLFFKGALEASEDKKENKGANEPETVAHANTDTSDVKNNKPNEKID